MSFPNKFKIIWWIALLTVMTIFGGFRIYAGEFKSFDVLLFVFWFVLVLFPIISEISIFGINVKKDIENATREIKSSLAEIKNQINIQPTFNFTPPISATPQEYKKKVEYEAKQEIKETNKESNHKFFSLEQTTPEKRTSHNQNAQERLDKVFNIEKLVSAMLTSTYGSDFRPQMKLHDESSGKKVVVDGLIIKDNRITEIVEIRFTSSSSFEAFYYIASRYRNRLYKSFGLRIPIRFIIVSETMDQRQAILIKNLIDQLNSAKSLVPGLPIIKADFFRYTGSELINVSLSLEKDKN